MQNLPIVRIVLNMQTKRPPKCGIFVSGKQDEPWGWHLCLAQTSRTTRSDYLHTPIGIIRTPGKDYPDSTRRLSEQPTTYLGCREH